MAASPTPLRIAAVLFVVLPFVLTAEPIHVSGRVQIPAETVQGVSGALVELLPQAGEAPIATTKTDAAGFFELAVPESGCFRVRMRAAGYLTVENPFLPLVGDTDLPRVPAFSASDPRVQGIVGQTFDGWVFGAQASPAVPPPQSGFRLVRGNVSNFKDAPAPGSLVWSDGSPAIPCAKAGAKGAFEIRLPASGAARLRAAAAGYLPSEPREPSPPGAKPISLKLEPAGSISGRVVDEAGRPLARVRVEALPDPSSTGEPSRESAAWSRSDGRFRLSALVPGRLYRLTIAEDGFAPASVPVDALPSDRPPVPVRIVLERGASMFGKVINPEGQPVQGAELALTLSEIAMINQGLSRSSAPLAKATSDSKGAFALSHLSPGHFHLRVERKGFVTLSRPDVEVPSRAAKVDLGILTLDRGLAIEGQVTDPSGAPMSGVGVVLILARGERSFSDTEFKNAQTDSEGRFRFEDLRKGARFDISAEHSGYVPVAVRSVEAPTLEPLRIEMKAGRTLAGRVRGPAGEPVPKADLYLQLDTTVRTATETYREIGARSLGTTDEEGRFRCPGIEPGTVEIGVRAQGYAFAQLKGVQIPEESDVEGLEIVLRKGSVLEIRALDSRHQPVPGVVITANRLDPAPLVAQSSLQGRTDDEGRYRLEGLDPGRYDVFARSEQHGHVEASVEITAEGVTRRDLVFPAGVEVSGRVSDEAGVAVPGANLILSPVESDAAVAAVSSADGAFRFPAVSDGTFRLSGYAPGFARTVAPGEVQVAGREVRGLVLQLSRGTTLTGRVLGLDPEEREGVSIQAHRMDLTFSQPQMGRTDPEGRYKLANLPPGDWRFTALAGKRSVQETLQLAPGVPEAVLDFRFPTSGFILSGRVIADHAPLAGAQVWASSNGGSFQAVTGPDGVFRLSNLPPGHYSLSVSGPEEGMGTGANVDLDGNREVALDFTTGGLRGTIFAADSGAPVANALVHLSGFAPVYLPARTTDAAGGFAVSRLSSGTYRVFVQKEGFAPAQVDVKVPPGAVGTVRIELKPAP